ncbi:Os06g0699000 [Oryza sativa Japonica Group]|nr:hypothetical protein [Oryza sativa Japonica Group]BAS99321.1 Os06g0699000 [Oryza sativa Japonica Group]
MHCLYVLSWGGLGLDYEGLVRVIPTMEVTDDDDPNYHGTDFVGVGEGEDERNEYTDEGNNVDEEEDEAATDVARKREM